MVDSHYIKRGDKIYGPYYYRSYRVGKKVKKEYLGKYYPKKIKAKESMKSLLFSFVLLILIASIFYLIPHFKGITSKVTAELGSTTLESNESQQIPDNLAREIYESIASSQSNWTESINTTPESNGSEQINENNATQEAAKDLITELIEENASNATATEPATPSDTVLSSETLVQHKAIIGMPVRWTKRIILEKPGNITIELPQDAVNITVKKIEKETSEVILTGSMAITGQVTATINLTGRKMEPTLFNILKYLFRKMQARITGHAIDETAQRETNESGKIIEIKENVTEVEIEYYTEAPAAMEKIISPGKKEIAITGPNLVHYENITAFTSVQEIVPLEKQHAISLYHLVNGGKELTPFIAYDDNSNGYIDRIEWIVPSLSNQTYETSITLINVQSYPILNGNWTVFFNTTGDADLKITAINGTTWNYNNNTCGSETCQIRFDNLTCGNNLLSPEWQENSEDGTNNSVFYFNYSCNEIGSETSWELSTGKHYLKFEFGSDVGYAYNDVGIDITGCTNITSSGVYNLTGPITNWAGTAGGPACINISVSDVIFDCQGWNNWIDGTDTTNSIGIKTENLPATKLTNITVRNCNLTDWDSAGIAYVATENSTIDNVTLRSNLDEGIVLSGSIKNNVTGVNSSFNGNNGIYLSSSHLTSLSNITVSNNTIKGIAFIQSNLNNLTNASATKNLDDGIYIESSVGEILTDINASGNLGSGVHTYQSSNNLMINVNSTRNLGGIYLDINSNRNQVHNCTMSDNRYDGLYLRVAMANNITGCRIENNSGLKIESHPTDKTINSSFNRLWNNIINNTPNGGRNIITMGQNYTNYFNTTKVTRINILGGSWIAGNYWSDYSGTSADGDYISDTAYVINSSAGPKTTSNMTDALPLTLSDTFDFNITGCVNITTAGRYRLNKSITNWAGSEGCINITVSDVEIDCIDWNNWIDGSDSSTNGIKTSGESTAKLTNVSIKNCNLTDWGYGDYHLYTQNSTLDNLTSSSNTLGGIRFYSSSNNNLTNINASGNSVYGIRLTISSNYNTLTNITASSNSQIGIYLISSSNNNLTNINASNNSWYGIHLDTGSNYNTLINITASSNSYYGIYLSSSSSNNFTSITASSNSYYGILLYSSSNKNQIINSTIKGNERNGLYLYNSSFNNITGSTIENNSALPYAGIQITSHVSDALSNSSYNRFWNNIINNTPNSGKNWNLTGINYTNYFNTTKTAGTNIIGGSYIAGNYWSDYSGTSANGDFIGDTPYVINATYLNDSLPLVLTDAYYSELYNVSGCRNITQTGTYKLNKSITNWNAEEGACINITVSDVEIDCGGWNNWIDGSNSYTTVGINAEGLSTAKLTNVSIKNCNLTDWGYGDYHAYTQNSTLDNITASGNSWDGIYLYSSSNNILTNITASSNSYYGILLDSSSNNNLSSINASSNSYYGIYLDTSSNNTLSNITASSNSYYGIYLSSSSRNQIINSTILDNKQNGLYLSYSSFNNLTGTRIENNSVSGYAGIYIYSHASDATLNSSYNRFWNNIINNTPNGGKNVITYGENYTNYFNTTQVVGTNILGKPWIGGNYWSDYTGIDADGDGIGDTDYVINSTYMNDSLPLMYNNPPLIVLYAPENESASTSPVDFIYNVTDDNNIANCSLIRMFPGPVTVLQTDTIVTKNINQSITQDLDAGNYIWLINCTDTGNKISSSVMRNITVNNLSDTYTNITGCVNITTGGLYRLNRSITDWNAASGACINITVSDVIFDCEGWANFIDGRDTSYTIGINSEGLSNAKLTNVSVKNCNLSDWGGGGASKYGESVMYTNTENSSIDNITVSSSVGGIYLSYSPNNTLSNINASSNSDNGIYLSSSSNNTLSNINASSNTVYGIYLSLSSNNQIINSTFTENTYYDFYISATSDTHCSNNLTNVTGSGNGAIAYYNQSVNLSDAHFSELILCNADNSNLTNITIDASASKKNNLLLLSRTDNSTLTGINSSFNYNGLYFSSSSNNNLTNINASSNSYYGIYLDTSSNNTLTNINASSNSYGILFSSSSNNLLTNINASSNSYGIYLSSSSKNQIINSTIKDNKVDGLLLQYSSFNNITGSRIENNSVSAYVGIRIWSSTTATSNSSYNRIWNNIINNTPNGGRNWKTTGINYTNYFNTTLTAGTNILGKPWIGGNYWSDYTGTDATGDYIGDTAYVINGSLMNDSLPLVYATTQVAPNITVVTITPNPAYTNSTLNCSGTYTDKNVHKGNVSITWYNGSAQYSSVTILNVANGSMVSNATLSGIQSKGETWNCTINATDANNAASDPNSTTITISNFVPTTPDIGGPANASRTIGNSVILRCANSTDADGDTINYVFYGDTSANPITLLQNGTGTTYAWSTTDGSTYYWRCKAEDNQDASAFTAQKTFVENSLPSKVDLIYPAHDSSITNRSPQLNWSASNDADGDSITYQINLTCHPSCSVDNRLFNSSAGQNWTNISSRLLYFWDDQYYYNWTVRAFDGYEFSAWNNTPFTLKLSSIVSLIMLNASVNFSTPLQIGATTNTTTNDPFPLSIRNNGNCFVSINMSNETDLLWSTQKNPSSYFKYKIDNLTGQENSFNWTASITSWTNAPVGNNTVISFLNYTDATDSAEIDVLVSVPPDEPAGAKTSRLVFTGWYVRET